MEAGVQDLRGQQGVAVSQLEVELVESHLAAGVVVVPPVGRKVAVEILARQNLNYFIVLLVPSNNLYLGKKEGSKNGLKPQKYNKY